jgi:hypothetical protein
MIQLEIEHRWPVTIALTTIPCCFSKDIRVMNQEPSWDWREWDEKKEILKEANVHKYTYFWKLEGRQHLQNIYLVPTAYQWSFENKLIIKRENARPQRLLFLCLRQEVYY